jgi:hypothetical protein
MIITARQLEDLHRQSGGNGQVVLPYRARLTPLAHDWLRQRKLTVGYSDATPQKLPATATSTSNQPLAQASSGGARFLWWCDGPCGPAKAAVTSLAREMPLAEASVGQSERDLVPAIKYLATEIKNGRVGGAVLLVKSAAPAGVLANRCPSVRAITGTCLDAIEQGVAQVAANVLIVEHPYKTLAEVRNLVGRFVKAQRPATEQIEQQLKELGSCA